MSLQAPTKAETRYCLEHFWLVACITVAHLQARSIYCEKKQTNKQKQCLLRWVRLSAKARADTTKNGICGEESTIFIAWPNQPSSYWEIYTEDLLYGKFFNRYSGNYVIWIWKLVLNFKQNYESCSWETNRKRKNPIKFMHQCVFSRILRPSGSIVLA